MKSLRVLSVASEIYPLIKIGELADVTGALPIALKSEGVEVRTVVPGYPSVMNSLGLVEGVIHLPHFFGAEARLLRATSGELGLFVLDAPHLFSRAGSPYLRADGMDWPDNALRFAALARIAADIGLGFVSSFVPDVVHVLTDGRIVRSGGKELALELEEKGYGWIESETAGAARS